MKKLLLIFFCLPMIGFGQNGITYNQNGLVKGYYENGNLRFEVNYTRLEF